MTYKYINSSYVVQVGSFSELDAMSSKYKRFKCHAS